MGPITVDDDNAGVNSLQHRVYVSWRHNFANPLCEIYGLEVAKMSLNFIICLCLSICLSACNNLKTAELIFVIFNMEVSWENLSRH